MSFTGGIGSYSWGLALALSLTFAAIFSYMTLLLSPKRSLRVRADPSQRRAFKGGILEFGLEFESPTEERRATVELKQVPEGADARLVPRGEHGHALVVSSKFSGAFTGWSLKIGTLDPIGLFSRSEDIWLDVTAVFLPVSLLARREEVVVHAAMLGDRPSGSRGFGQEFYSAELYDGSHDSKGILWKRQARLGMDNLMVRVGEANVPESLTICFLESQPRVPRELPGWMDLASEAISLIGLVTFEAGSYLRVIHNGRKGSAVAEARDERGLADLLVWVWRTEPLERTGETPSDASIVVTGEAEMADSEVFTLLLKKPSVVLTYAKEKVSHAHGVVFFSGKESLSQLVSMVLSR